MLRILAVYGAVSLMTIPVHAACDISGYWSLEAEGIPLPSNPFVKFEPLDNAQHTMFLNACITFNGTATARDGWIIGEIEVYPPPPLNEIKIVWELSDDCQWASGWIYPIQPSNYGSPPIKSSLRKVRDKSETELPEGKRKNRKCFDTESRTLIPNR